MNIFTLVLAFLPGFAWLFFYLQEDLHPEPKRLILKTFILGGIFALIALVTELLFDCGANQFQNCLTQKTDIRNVILPSLIIFSLIEEFFKFGAAYFSIHKDPAFNEPVDAMIYAIVAALGFATVENLGALSLGNGAQTGLLSNALEIASLRFVGATLLHSLTSGIIGYYWAVSIRDFGEKRFIVMGIAIATGLHAFFNYLIINYWNGFYPILLVVIIGFFVLNDFENLKRKKI
ncbi:MAG: PrsW family glutamic-type intramembrane protease [Patescibacteria group bacterium]